MCSGRGSRGVVRLLLLLVDSQATVVVFKVDRFGGGMVEMAGSESLVARLSLIGRSTVIGR